MFRKSVLFTTFIALFALVFASCQMNKPIDTSKIDDVNAKWAEALEAGDAAGIAALYTSDAIVMPPFSDALSTRQDITDIWQGMLDMGVTGVDLVTDEIIPAGDMAVERGEYTVFAGDVDIDHGKYMVLWKMENGQWRIFRDIWNSSLPAEGTDEGTDGDSDPGSDESAD